MHLLFSTGARNARPTRITGFDLISTRLDLFAETIRYDLCISVAQIHLPCDLVSIFTMTPPLRSGKSQTICPYFLIIWAVHLRRFFHRKDR